MTKVRFIMALFLLVFIFSTSVVFASDSGPAQSGLATGPVATTVQNSQGESSDVEELEEGTLPKSTEIFSLDTGASIIYANNVFGYASDNKSEYRDYSNPNRYKGVKSIEDFITNVYVIPRVQKDFFDFGTTIFSLGAEGNIYTNNHAKTYSKYSASVRQKFGNDKHLMRLGYEYIPSYFVRTLYDRNSLTANKYQMARFDSSALKLKYWNQLNDKLSWWLRYTLEKKDYNNYFEERDTLSNQVSLDLGYKPTSWLRLNPSFSNGWYNAKGKDDTVFVQPDISRIVYDVGLSLGFYPMGSRFSYTVGYDYAYTCYTTSHNSVDDPYHAGRHDNDYDITGRVNYALKDNIDLFAQYQYSLKNVKTQAADPTYEPEAILGSVKQAVEMGVKLAF